ncbi:MAG: prolipoprotein diacylglyceryl transferase [Pedobacter sp.]|nr:prolipoprotein diacylglyceryl transferase [Chitinophagaceae bacterium]
MYPNLYYVFKDFFGVDWSGLKLVNSFGFFVAIAFMAAAYALTIELKRKQQQGLLTYTEQSIMVGAEASFGDLLTNFLLGFIFGFKIIGAFIISDALNDPQSFILSSQGSLPMGILVGLIFGGLKWWEKHKEKLAKPEQRTIRIWPHDRVGDLVIFAAIFGFSGAKIFHNLENWNEFIKDPIGALISFSGLTFYGGLICAGAAIILYARRHKIGILHLCDAFAPALMLAYAVGRMGCQVSGDGDWGIMNSAFMSTPTGQVISSTPQQFHEALVVNQDFYINQFKSLDAAHHLAVQSFWHLPNWLFAYNYPHNVINEGIKIQGCNGQYCSQLPIPVFPTSFYEIIVCGILFIVLWMSRKRLKLAGQMFGFYLILNGLERFMIEKIRVNTKYEALPFQPTQAELISLVLVICGAILFWTASKKPAKVEL